jgi:hypothetical protein
MLFAKNKSSGSKPEDNIDTKGSPSTSEILLFWK